MNSEQKALPSTKAIVKAALMECNEPRGVSLFRLKKFIAEKLNIDITVRRKGLINDELRAYIDAGELRNVTGRGLNGRLRLAAGVAKRWRKNLDKEKHLVKQPESVTPDKNHEAADVLEVEGMQNAPKKVMGRQGRHGQQGRQGRKRQLPAVAEYMGTPQSKRRTLNKRSLVDEDENENEVHGAEPPQKRVRGRRAQLLNSDAASVGY